MFVVLESKEGIIEQGINELDIEALLQGAIEDNRAGIVNEMLDQEAYHSLDLRVGFDDPEEVEPLVAPELVLALIHAAHLLVEDRFEGGQELPVFLP